VRFGGLRLLIPLALVDFTLFAALNGVLAVLLPQRIAAIDPTGKVAALALVTSLSFAVTAVSQPLIGALSDRTRSRFGRRIPWMLGGAIAGGAAIGLMGGAGSVLALAVLWSIGQFAFNGTDVAASAYIVDIVTRRRRGMVAGLLGIAGITGGASGAVTASALTDNPALVYGTLAGAVIVAVVVFALLVRDRQSPGEPMPWRVGTFLRGFLVDPRRHPAFAWIFVWRLCFALAAGALQGYLLYIFTDYLQVGNAEAARLVGAATAVGAAFVLISVVVGGWLSDRLGRRKPFLLFASAVIVVGAIGPLAAPSVVAVFVLAAAMGVGLGLAISCGTALAAEAIPEPERHAARGLGLFNIATNVGQTLAPLVAAALISVSGYPALFAIAATLMLVAAVLAMHIPEQAVSRSPIRRIVP
jgi:MFS family permease